jgi:hypothetical protein
MVESLPQRVYAVLSIALVDDNIPRFELFRCSFCSSASTWAAAAAAMTNVEPPSFVILAIIHDDDDATSTTKGEEEGDPLDEQDSKWTDPSSKWIVNLVVSPQLSTINPPIHTPTFNCLVPHDIIAHSHDLHSNHLCPRPLSTRTFAAAERDLAIQPQQNDDDHDNNSNRAVLLLGGDNGSGNGADDEGLALGLCDANVVGTNVGAVELGRSLGFNEGEPLAGQGSACDGSNKSMLLLLLLLLLFFWKMATTDTTTTAKRTTQARRR